MKTLFLALSLIFTSTTAMADLNGVGQAFITFDEEGGVQRSVIELKGNDARLYYQEALSHVAPKQTDLSGEIWNIKYFKPFENNSSGFCREIKNTDDENIKYFCKLELNAQ